MTDYHITTINGKRVRLNLDNLEASLFALSRPEIEEYSERTHENIGLLYA